MGIFSRGNKASSTLNNLTGSLVYIVGQDVLHPEMADHLPVVQQQSGREAVFILWGTHEQIEPLGTVLMRGLPYKTVAVFYIALHGKKICYILRS